MHRKMPAGVGGTLHLFTIAVMLIFSINTAKENPK